MYAVIETGGKQYKVSEGDVIDIELLAAETGSTVTFDKVLLVAKGEDVKVGNPVLPKAEVTGKVLAETRGPKLIVFHMRRRKDSRKKTGHRQDLLRVRIDKIKG